MEVFQTNLWGAVRNWRFLQAITQLCECSFCLDASPSVSNLKKNIMIRKLSLNVSAPKINLGGSCTDIDICNDTYAECINFKCACQTGSTEMDGYCSEYCTNTTQEAQRKFVWQCVVPTRISQSGFQCRSLGSTQKSFLPISL